MVMVKHTKMVNYGMTDNGKKGNGMVMENYTMKAVC